MNEQRWGFKDGTREFVAYAATAEEAAKRFARVLNIHVSLVLPDVKALGDESAARLVTDERKAPGA